MWVLKQISQSTKKGYRPRYGFKCRDSVGAINKESGTRQGSEFSLKMIKSQCIADVLCIWRVWNPSKTQFFHQMIILILSWDVEKHWQAPNQNKNHATIGTKPAHAQQKQTKMVPVQVWWLWPHKTLTCTKKTSKKHSEISSNLLSPLLHLLPASVWGIAIPTASWMLLDHARLDFTNQFKNDNSLCFF